MLERLAVSLPSEITTSAFFMYWPRCASGTASTMVSYIAVPPFGTMRPSARDKSGRSMVHDCSSTGSLLKR